VLTSIRALPTLPRFIHPRFIHGAKTALCLLTFMTVLRRKARRRMTLDRQNSHSRSPNKRYGVSVSEKEQQSRAAIRLSKASAPSSALPAPIDMFRPARCLYCFYCFRDR
jgi:hypothetical protein